MSNRKTFLLLLLASILLCLTQVSGLPNGLRLPIVVFGNLAWIAPLPLFYALHGRPFRQTFAYAFLAFFVSYFLTLYWLTIAMSVYGGLAWILSILLLSLLIGLLALFMSAGVAMALTGTRMFHLPAIFTLPTAWVAMEYARGYCFTGFPWANLADSQSLFNLPLIQMAEVTGQNGVTWILVFASALFYEIVKGRRQWRAVVIFLVVLAGIYLYGVHRLKAEDELRARLLQSSPRLRVAALQGNIPQDQKWDRAFVQSILRQYSGLLEEAEDKGADLAVWPEAAFPLVVDRATTRFPYKLRSGIPQVVGLPTRESEGVLLNSAFLLDEDLAVRGAYDKTQLVPFGEYVPLKKLLFFVDELVPAVGDFRSGLKPKSVRLVRLGVEWVFGIVLCYEDVFPAISRTLAEDGALFLANITNDAWYGRSSATYQHLSISVFRAVETRLPLIRSTNTGMTASIAPSGRIESLLPWFERGLLLVEVPHYQREPKTFYVRHGDWFAKLALVLTLSWALACIVSHFQLGYHALQLKKG